MRVRPLLLTAVTALAGSFAVAAAATAATTRGVAGPLVLSKASFDQHNSNLIFQVSTKGSLPSLKDLVTSPSHVGSKDERYLCLQVESKRSGRSLYCPGGSVSRNHITLGYGTYGQGGTVKHRKDLSAKITDRSSSGLTLKFSLGASRLQPGKFGWRVVSGWTGSKCTPAPPAATEPAPTAASDKNRCLDNYPGNGMKAGKIYKLVVAGCTSPGGQFSAGPSKGKRVALTFDDGPSSYTETVLHILDKYGVHSTFFQIGEQVSGGSTASRDILAQGSEIGNHSYHHENLPSYDSLKATSKVIERVTGFRPCEFRPPYGATNGGLVSEANSLNMSTILWDVDTNDWQLPGSGSIFSTATSAGPGSIVLMHDGGGNRSETVAALPGIIENLQRRGFKLVTVTELLGGKLKLEEAH